MPATAAPWIPPRSAARWRCNRQEGLRGWLEGRMRTDTTRATSATFAANRAQGAVKFDVKLEDGVTRRGVLHESGSLRVRFPSPEGDGLSGVFVNTAGGIAGGDRFDIDIAAGEGTALTLTTAAAEQVYRAGGPPGQRNLPRQAEA